MTIPNQPNRPIRQPQGNSLPADELQQSARTNTNQEPGVLTKVKQLDGASKPPTMQRHQLNVLLSASSTADLAKLVQARSARPTRSVD